jgi:hypothetical protein
MKIPTNISRVHITRLVLLALVNLGATYTKRKYLWLTERLLVRKNYG